MNRGVTGASDPEPLQKNATKYYMKPLPRSLVKMPLHSGSILILGNVLCLHRSTRHKTRENPIRFRKSMTRYEGLRA